MKCQQWTINQTDQVLVNHHSTPLNRWPMSTQMNKVPSSYSQTELLQGERAIFERIAARQPALQVLNDICLLAEHLFPHTLASVLLFDAKNDCLRHGAAPHLPDDYCTLVDKLPIGPCQGSCGTAAYRKQQVIVADIAHDPLWANYRELAASYGLKACWSTPILSKQQALLGTFALYYRQAGRPTEEELDIVARFSQLVTITLENQQLDTELAASQQRLLDFAEASGDWLWEMDADLRFSWFSDQVEQTTGVPPSWHYGKRREDLSDVKISPELWDEHLATLATHQPFQDFEYQRIGPDGVRWLRSSAVPVFDEEGMFQGYRGVGRDITPLRRAEERARTTLERFINAIEVVDETYALYDAEERLVICNQRYRDLHRPIELRPGMLFSDCMQAQLDHGLIIEAIGCEAEWKAERLARFRKAEGEFIVRRKDDLWFLVRERRTEDGGVIHTGLDISRIKHSEQEMRALNARLSYQATHDMLTGLLNRPTFQQKLHDLILSAQREAREHALLVMDLDRFKLVNDLAGHRAGDQLLREIANHLRAQVRRHDTIARLGGDEFGILIEDCNYANAIRVAEAITKVLSNFSPSLEQQPRFTVHASVGLVAITQATTSAEAALHEADLASYSAKRLGGARVYALSDRSERIAHVKQITTATLLPEALEKGNLVLYGQPIQALLAPQDENPLWLEVLLRVRNKNNNATLPLGTIPIAELYGQIARIDRWVITTALALQPQEPLYLSINLSAISVCDPLMQTFVLEQLAQSPIPAQAICFEVTETAAIRDTAQAKRFFDTLKNAGCRFALDDFGAGLSSFEWLQTLPFDYLKIDGRYIKDLEQRPENEPFVQALHQLAHSLGMQTIAEHVESAATLQTLTRLGVNYAQGWHLGLAEPLEEYLPMTVNSYK